MTTYRTANQIRYNRTKEALALVEALAKDAGYKVAGNDKGGIDEFLEDAKSEKIEIHIWTDEEMKWLRMGGDDKAREIYKGIYGLDKD